MGYVAFIAIIRFSFRATLSFVRPTHEEGAHSLNLAGSSCERGGVACLLKTRHYRMTARYSLPNGVCCILEHMTRKLFFSAYHTPCHLLYSPFFSLSFLVKTQIRGHTAGSPPPCPLQTCLGRHFYRQKESTPYFLAYSGRVKRFEWTRSRRRDKKMEATTISYQPAS